jgi:hypothetical protein
MVAPSYAAMRGNLAEQIGLGRKPDAKATLSEVIGVRQEGGCLPSARPGLKMMR